MLYPINGYLLDRFKQEITFQRFYEAQNDHLAQHLRGQKSHHRGIIQGLRDLGHAFVDIGQRLDRIESPS